MSKIFRVYKDHLETEEEAQDYLCEINLDDTSESIASKVLEVAGRYPDLAEDFLVALINCLQDGAEIK